MEVVNFEFVSLRISNTGSAVEFPDGKKIKITAPECRVLKCLLEKKGALVTYNELEKVGWQGEVVARNSLAVVIYNLRKFTKSYSITINNEPMLGYRLNVSKENLKVDSDIVKANVIEYVRNRVEKKYNYEIITLVLASMTLILLYFYIDFSWVRLDCDNVDGIDICYFENNKPKDVPKDSTGILYFINDNYYEVNVD